MSFKRFAAVCTAAVLAGWAATAVAADQEYGRSGPYIGAGASYGIENFDVPDAGGGWGYNLKAGYRFNQYFAIEAGADQILNMDSDLGEVSTWVLTGNVKGFLLDGPIQPFAVGGVGWAGVDQSNGVDDEGLGFRFGAGVDLYATRNIAITAEVGYILGTGDVGDFNVIPVSLGVLYRFY